MEPEEYLWARLTPFDEKRGAVVKRFGIYGTMYQGGITPTWYKISPELAAKLIPRLQNDNDPRSLELFQIYSEEDRQRVDARENELRLAQIGLVSASAAIPVTPLRSIDLRADPRGVPIPERSGRAAALPGIPPLRDVPQPAPVAAALPLEPDPVALPTLPLPVTASEPEALEMPPGTGDLTTKTVPTRARPSRR